LDFELVPPAEVFPVLYQLCLRPRGSTSVHGTGPAHSQASRKIAFGPNEILQSQSYEVGKMDAKLNSVLEFTSPNCPWLKGIYQHHCVSDILVFVVTIER